MADEKDEKFDEKEMEKKEEKSPRRRIGTRSGAAIP